MASTVDVYMLERKVGKNAADSLRAAWRLEIRNAVNVQGESKKATVTARYKNDRLDRLTFAAPDYIFKQNFGFIGEKSNHVMMHLKPTNVLTKAINTSGAIDTLADELTDLRAEEVITAINFIRNGQ